jgi:hypothetical protein
MECNLCSPMKNVLGDLWIRFVEGDWQGDFGEAKRWDEKEDFEVGWRSESRGLWCDKKEAKWLDLEGGLKNVVWFWFWGVVNR